MNYRDEIRRAWDIGGIVRDLREEEWIRYDQDRRIRTAAIDNQENFIATVKNSTRPDMWAAYERSRNTPDLVDQYADQLATMVSSRMREHVFLDFHDGNVYATQWEDRYAPEGWPVKDLPGVLDWVPEE